MSANERFRTLAASCDDAQAASANSSAYLGRCPLPRNPLIFITANLSLTRATAIENTTDYGSTANRLLQSNDKIFGRDQQFSKVLRAERHHVIRQWLRYHRAIML